MAGTLLEEDMNAALNPKAAKRPKPLVGLRAIERVLLRNVFAPVPEAKLIVAVICQAMSDAVSPDEYSRRMACEFLRSRRLDFFADLVDINPEFVREVARRAHYLPTPTIPSIRKNSRKMGEK